LILRPLYSPCSRPPFHFASFPPRRSADLDLSDFGRIRRDDARRIVVAERQPVRPRQRPDQGLRVTADCLPDVVLVIRGRLPQARSKSTRLNSSHGSISYAVFCLKKKKTEI